MKPTHLITLMTALAIGSALAATAPTVSATKGTNAGTIITNVATATFDNPEGGAAPTVSSNAVTTKVEAKPDFNITYANGATDDSGTSVIGGVATNPDYADYRASAVAGTVVSFKYTAVNNGNSDQTITLETPTLTNGGLTGNITTVKYYSSLPTDVNGDGLVTKSDLDDAINSAKEIPSIPVKPAGYDPISKTTNTGMADFYLVYVTPAGTKTDAVGASPVGTGLQWDGTTAQPVTETPGKLFLQYSKVTIQETAGLVGPSGAPAGNAAAGTYTSTDGTSTTTISKLQNEQTAAPAATTTSVIFSNTLMNNGSQTDNFALSTTDLGGATKVTFLTSTGLTFNTTGQIVSITPASGPAYDVTYKLVNGVPTVIGLKSGDSADFQTKVEYGNATSYKVKIGVDSGDIDTTVDKETTNVVNRPSVVFGNGDNEKSTAPTDTAAPASGDPGQTVTFPLEIKNTGGSGDTYYVTSSTLTFTVVNTATGAQTTVNVTPKYYPDADCNGVADSTTEISSTNLLSVAGGATSCVVMSVTIPAGATVQTVTFNETLKGTLVGDTPLTVSDKITVNLTNTTVPGTNTGGSGFAMAKFVEGGNTATPYPGITPPAGYGTGEGNRVVPGGTIRYVIIGKNTYNTSISGVVLTDVLDKNVNYASALCAVYSAADIKLTTTTCTAAPTVDSDGKITVKTTPVNLASGEYVRVDLSVTVK